MKPGFALSLSFDGISLLHRAAGGWRHVGEVAPDSPDLRAALAALREKALQLEPGGISCKVILPNDQIRYLSVETGSFQGDAGMEIVRSALEHATPYGVADLAFDTSPDGPLTHVAAVARDTLAEAEAFALEHDFAPVCFAAVPGGQPFLGEPWFGPAKGFEKITGGEKVEPDGIAVVVIGPAKFPADAPEPAPDSAAEDGPPPAGFASRRSAPAAADEATAPTAPERPRITLSTGPAAAGTAPAPEELPLAQEVVDVLERPEPDPGPEPDPAPGAAPLKVAVTAPVLDIPDGPGEDPPAGKASFGAFLSRRRRTPEAEPPPPRPRPEAVAISLPERQIPKDEAGRMTVFGARGAPDAGGKPKHLGLVLTAVLLVFLAIAAAWASIYLEDGVAGLFRVTGAGTEIAAEEPRPDPAAPSVRAPAPSVQDSDPAGLAPQPPAALESLPAPRHLSAAPSAAEPPPAPALTDTDVAVLDALQNDPGLPAGEDAGADAPDDTAALSPGLSDELLPEGLTDPEAEFDGQSGDAVEEAPEEAPGTAETRYAATGIWPAAPEAPDSPAIIGVEDVFVASIDRTDLSQDALALPPPESFDTDAPPAIVTSPTAAGTDFALDTRGLVEPSAEGALNPDGILIYAGAPPRRPPGFPVRFETEPDTSVLQERLAGLRPRPRPGDLAEQTERSQLGGLTREELATVRPRERPQSAQEQAEEAPEELEDEPEPEPEAQPQATAQAVVASIRPDARPAGFASRARSTPGQAEPQEERASAAATLSAAVQPRIPSSTSVARQATLKNAINLRDVNLIGVYGTPSNRRALVRLPSGRYKKVKVGDTVDGGRIVAIGDSELRYQKGGRNMTLKIPSG